MTIATPCGEWVTLPLSDAAFLVNTGAAFPGPYGQFTDGVIWAVPDSRGPGHNGFPDFYFPGLVLDPTTPYQVEITFDPASTHDAGGRGVVLSGIHAGIEQYDYETNTLPFESLYDGTANTADVVSVTIGPGVAQWDDPFSGVAAGFNNIWFETDYTGAPDPPGGAVSLIRVMQVCVGVVRSAPSLRRRSPFRQYPRSDGLGMSSHPRLYPPPRSAQASNRRAGGYL